MSPVARWLRFAIVACAAAVVMALYAPDELQGSGWAPEAMRAIPEAAAPVG